MITLLRFYFGANAHVLIRAAKPWYCSIYTSGLQLDIGISGISPSFRSGPSSARRYFLAQPGHDRPPAAMHLTAQTRGEKKKSAFRNT
jgi:hypothetical protein